MDCTTRTLLVADADEDSRIFLAHNLTADGYEVMEAGSAFTARRLLQTSVIDLAVIDAEFPDGGGLEIVRSVRGAADGSRVDRLMPLVTLISRCTEIERLRAFERGADDVLARPYSYPELRARVRALLWRCGEQPLSSRIRVGPLELDALAHQAWLHGEPLGLSTKEFMLLRVLAGEPGRVFTRAELMRSIWGWGEHERSRTLDAHACRLRRKLRHGGDQFIVNVWGVGYRLASIDAAVTERDDPDAVDAAA